jgi:hypothetical protein
VSGASDEDPASRLGFRGYLLGEFATCAQGLARATRAAVSFDRSFSLANFTFRAPHERKFGKGQDELLALLALFHKSRTTTECPLEI